jgi:hypothetical protein
MTTKEIIDSLLDRAYSGKVPDLLSERAAAEIERLSSLVRFQDRVIRSGDVGCLSQDERSAVSSLLHAAEQYSPKWAAPLRGLLERMK